MFVGWLIGVLELEFVLYCEFGFEFLFGGGGDISDSEGDSG